VDELLCNNSKVLWIPKADFIPGVSSWASYTISSGKWVSIKEACFLSSSHGAFKMVVNVARRAGLNIPDSPSHILQVSATKL